MVNYEQERLASSSGSGGDDDDGANCNKNNVTEPNGNGTQTIVMLMKPIDDPVGVLVAAPAFYLLSLAELNNINHLE